LESGDFQDVCLAQHLDELKIKKEKLKRGQRRHESRHGGTNEKRALQNLAEK
jgi:hypothetical protein